MPDTADIYRVKFFVKPSPLHAFYWEVAYGYLHVRLRGMSHEEARANAISIFKGLPYELAHPACACARYRPKDPLEYSEVEEIVKGVGVSLLFVGVAIGKDEEGVLSDPFRDRDDDEQT